ncbi:unnamed protein product [Acanthoscelides obtectus]|uniref:Swi5-dependent recombination DNA repair protein 1 homolog n=1 Tax=Acanthoscelides obtectus TaxID=200917 RepID=A0A9P0K2W6_ACAOB|nr:unnamed protein product [Acanthoscelides obtectus]CAK1620221.1 hypothetical protein AOBTE_LOCUS247 [Acanthoscelides obtectus]
MSSTPDIKSSLQKFSPFGAGISKNLLTPCRRVGLSRKRGSLSTPNSTIKTPTERPNINLSQQDSSETTPIRYLSGKQSKHASKNVKSDETVSLHSTESSCKKVLAKNFSLENCEENSAYKDKMKNLDLTFGSSTTELGLHRAEEQDNLTPRTKNYGKAKVQNFENSTQKELNLGPMEIFSPTKLGLDRGGEQDNLTPRNNDYCKAKFENSTQKELKLEPVDTFEKTQGIEIGAQENKNSMNMESGKKQNEVDTKCKRSRKLNKQIPKKLENKIDYDSDDDFKPLDAKSLKKRKSSTADNKLKKAKSVSLKDCNVPLDRIDSETLKSKSFITSDNEDLYDNEFTVIRKKKRFILEDDNNSLNNSPQSVLLPKVVSNIPEDDEDMAFTSTPEQEKGEKKTLINSITELEKSIIQKKKKLEDLKQASIYKQKHNIEELDALTNRWKTGCELGLKCLLKQLQAHGPIDMATLVANLHIPDDVVAQLSLSDNS